MNRHLYRIVLISALQIYLTKSLLTQLNEYADPTTPVRESVTVKGVGRRDWPAKVDFLTGRSEILGRTVAIPVLPRVAETTHAGSQADIVIGRGLLGKWWIELEETHRSETRAFKIVHVGIFVLMFSVWSLIYIKLSKVFSRSKRLATFSVALLVGLSWFYVAQDLP